MIWKKKGKNGRKNKIETEGERRTNGKEGRKDREKGRKEKRKQKLPLGHILLQCITCITSEDEDAGGHLRLFLGKTSLRPKVNDENAQPSSLQGINALFFKPTLSIISHHLPTLFIKDTQDQHLHLAVISVAIPHALPSAPFSWLKY